MVVMPIDIYIKKLRCLFRGKRGPKPSFVNVTCPNKDCKDHGKIEKGNVVGNGTYKNKNGTL
ncbi:MAG: hypothetical protein LBB45_05070 [Methanobrevibacter sp.]|jgi:hypothetical protein|nr:hypothetical protein [Candidatus Methanovirga basalitermitum]